MKEINGKRRTPKETRKKEIERGDMKMLIS